LLSGTLLPFEDTGPVG
jgi:hypothetical protein